MSLTACANLPAKDTPPPIPVGSPAEDQVAASARPTIRQIEEAKAEAPKTPAPKPVHEPEGTWHLEKHKLKGPGEPRKALLILKVQNKKSPGSTSIVCYNYGDFAIVETKSTSEVGSAELFVRHADPDHKHLCQEGFKGKNLNLKIREGGISGVAGDYVIVD
ncbi:MAG TPA: hypothetical protein PKC28_02035, partial [Bdellovibrionales bacterium]|nr:hypothetical protein [Bdellovibrionales bacterium]